MVIKRSSWQRKVSDTRQNSGYDEAIPMRCCGLTYVYYIVISYDWRSAESVLASGTNRQSCSRLLMCRKLVNHGVLKSRVMHLRYYHQFPLATCLLPPIFLNALDCGTLSGRIFGKALVLQANEVLHSSWKGIVKVNPSYLCWCSLWSSVSASPISTLKCAVQCDVPLIPS